MGRLWAQVRAVTGRTKHFAHPTGPISPPDTLEIVQDDGGWYLFHRNKEGQIITDTFHQSIHEAKAQAAFEFSVTEQDWNHEP